jgi:NAD(P)-dependent dehydrogenase (short-subunit alcohol dehydrogenase family)
MADRVCFITGVGGGTGEATARRFAQDGYRVAMLARKPDLIGPLEKELEGSRAFVCDVADLDHLMEVCDTVHQEMGSPHVVIHNAARGNFTPFLETEPENFEKNFRVNATVLLYLARAFAPAMIDRGSGVIIATGNTSAMRGVPNFALFAPTKAAQRILAQSLARDLGPKGIHVAYVIVDGMIGLETTRSRMPDRPADSFLDPNRIADAIHVLAHQDRTAWTFELDLRPYSEKF